MTINMIMIMKMIIIMIMIMIMKMIMIMIMMMIIMIDYDHGYDYDYQCDLKTLALLCSKNHSVSTIACLNRWSRKECVWLRMCCRFTICCLLLLPC